MDLRDRILAGGRALLICALSLASLTSVTAAVEESAHGPWTLRCEKPAASDANSCILYQNLVLKAGGQTVLQFAIGIAPGSATPTVLVSLPLGIALPPGIVIRIDNGKEAKFPVERCEPEGCQAGMKLRDQTIVQLSAGNKLEITFYDGNRQPITMPLSLEGFAAGFAALKASDTASPAQ